jgi:hypothetical protein
MGCTVSAPAASGAALGGIECRTSAAGATDQLPLLQGVLVISPGHRISAAAHATNPPRAVPGGRAEAAASLSA